MIKKKVDINKSDDNELIEYEPFQEVAQDTSFSNMKSTYSNLLSKISIMSYEENIELEESEVLEESEESEESEIFEEAKEPEPEALTEFPNDVYKDLIVLVTKHKLNNKAGNTIIQFSINIQSYQSHLYQKILKKDEHL